MSIWELKLGIYECRQKVLVLNVKSEIYVKLYALSFEENIFIYDMRQRANKTHTTRKTSPSPYPWEFGPDQLSQWGSIAPKKKAQL